MRKLLYIILSIVGIYVTGLRLFTFIFELGFKTEETDTFLNLFKYNIPDLISVIFCGYVVSIFLRRVFNDKKS